MPPVTANGEWAGETLIVWPEWCSTGIWVPNREQGGEAVLMVRFESLSLSPELIHRFESWIDWFDEAPELTGNAEAFKEPAFNAEGRALAEALARLVPESTRVEYHARTGMEVIKEAA